MSQPLDGILSGRANIRPMRNDNLFELLQNTVVGAIALHSFTLGFNNVAKHKNETYVFPPFNYMFYVLPIVYNQDAMETIKGSNELYSALIKEPAIVLGLQDRANKMSVKTFDSLNLAFSKRVLTLNKIDKTVELAKGFQSKRLPLPLSISSKENSVKKIQDCGFKLGAIFAKRNKHNIEFELNIRL
jgi:hypothetical protein